MGMVRNNVMKSLEREREGERIKELVAGVI